MYSISASNQLFKWTKCIKGYYCKWTLTMKIKMWESSFTGEEIVAKKSLHSCPSVRLYKQWCFELNAQRKSTRASALNGNANMLMFNILVKCISMLKLARNTVQDDVNVISFAGSYLVMNQRIGKKVKCWHAGGDDTKVGGGGVTKPVGIILKGTLYPNFTWLNITSCGKANLRDNWINELHFCRDK